MVDVIDSFSGEWRFLSNFSPHSVERPGVIFPTVEHGFVWHKTTNPITRKLILEQTTPGRVKRLGRKIDLRPDWEQIKLDVMNDLVWHKFDQHDDIRQKLLDTGDIPLIEGNHWGDTFWGVCNGVGHNHLGIILMDVRQGLRNKEDHG